MVEGEGGVFLHLAADDVWVLGELRVGVRLDNDTVRDAGIIISEPPNG